MLLIVATRVAGRRAADDALRAARRHAYFDAAAA